MLSNLSKKLSDTFAKLRGKGKISEADVDAAMLVNHLRANVAVVNLFGQRREFFLREFGQVHGCHLAFHVTAAQSSPRRRI